VTYVMVSKCISVFASVGHVRCKPRHYANGSRTKVMEIVKGVDDALHIATVAVIDGITIERLVTHSSNFVVCWIAIAEPVGHDEVNKIRRRYPLRIGSSVSGSFRF